MERRRAGGGNEGGRGLSEARHIGAVARKLAVIPHRMWVGKTEFLWSAQDPQLSDG